MLPSIFDMKYDNESELSFYRPTIKQRLAKFRTKRKLSKIMDPEVATGFAEIGVREKHPLHNSPKIGQHRRITNYGIAFGRHHIGHSNIESIYKVNS